MYSSTKTSCNSSIEVRKAIFKHRLMCIPFIVLSDEGLGPNLQSGDIEILVEDMEIIIRGDAINTVIGILRHFDSSSL